MSLADPLLDARAFVAESFPGARWALLSGSVVNGYRTPGSDLDVVVLLPTGDRRAPCRASQRYRSWPVEMLVYDQESLAHYLAKELPDRRPLLNRMVATGVQVGGADTAHLAYVQAHSAKVLAAGFTQ